MQLEIESLRRALENKEQRSKHLRDELDTLVKLTGTMKTPDVKICEELKEGATCYIHDTFSLLIFMFLLLPLLLPALSLCLSFSHCICSPPPPHSLLQKLCL